MTSIFKEYRPPKVKSAPEEPAKNSRHDDDREIVMDKKGKVRPHREVEKVLTAAEKRQAILNRVPKGEKRRALSTLETFQQKMEFVLDILRSRCCKDRPWLAQRGCRLLLLVLKHYKDIAMRVSTQGKVAIQDETVKLLGCTVPGEDAKLEAPFQSLNPALKVLLETLKAHQHNSQNIIVALACLAELKQIALLLVPAGAEIGGAWAKKAWHSALQKTLEGRETEFLLRKVADRVVLASKTTQQVEFAMQLSNVPQSRVQGGVEFLTPRLRQFVDRASLTAHSLASDAVSGHWTDNEGEPGRRDEMQLRKAYLEEIAREKQERLEAEYRAAHPELFVVEVEEVQSPKEKDGLSEDESEAEGEQDEKSEKEGSEAKKEEAEDSDDEDLPDIWQDSLWGHEQIKPDNIYSRAIGFGVHDEDDFDRLWRQPLTDALERTFPPEAAPNSKWATRAAAARRAENLKNGVPEEEADAIDDLIELEMIESIQGKLKARVIVRPRDRIQQNVSFARADQFIKPENVSNTLTAEVSKALRRSGNLLPKYGLGIKVLRRPASTGKLISKGGLPPITDSRPMTSPVR
eukprot:TRINITY_DN21109_c0_g1_i1.p1 TRINITY_DN21109_c0_g1~~TRINITY_DN21109_c0_g1_i1.p1  ORF type:complete len:590 (-),score=126.77 TRINITY_DN21109_c0_g1_i1:329-2056(-)